MVTEIQAILLNKYENTFKKDEQEIRFKRIQVGRKIDKDNGEVILIAVPNEIDLTKLEIHKYYNLAIDIPTMINEKSKIRLISVGV